MPRKSPKELKALATKLLRARDAGKEAYRMADECLEQLLKHCHPGDEIMISRNQVVRIVDNFAKGNKAWKPCGITRFDLQESRASDLTAKL